MTQINVTLGDALDRLTILDIKFAKGLSVDPDSIFPVEGSAGRLRSTKAYHELMKVNSRLWDIEDAIRKAHEDKDFKAVFQLSRMVIDNNRLRSSIKSAFDVSNNIDPEVKQYYTPK